jgi:F0F1-type ATP synthase assembly protein I
LIGFYLGKYLDGWLDTAPAFKYAFVVLGLVAAVKETVAIIKRAGEDADSPGR